MTIFLIAAVIFSIFFVYWLSGDFVTACIIFFAPLFLVSVIDIIYFKQNPFNGYAVKIFIVLGLTVTLILLFVDFLNIHILFLIYLIGVLLIFIIIRVIRHMNYISFLTILTSFQIAFVGIAILFNPWLRYLGFQGLENQNWDKYNYIFTQRGVSSIIGVQKINGRKILIYRGGFEKEYTQFDPYFIQCINGKLLFVSYERRRMLERIDLETMKTEGLRTEGPNTFFHLSPDALKGYTGSSFVPYPNREIVEFDTKTMKIIKRHAFRYPQWDTDKFQMDGFRSMCRIEDAIYAYSFRGRIIHYSSELEPRRTIRLNSYTSGYIMATCTRNPNRLLLTGFPFRLYVVDLDNFRLEKIKTLFLGWWIESIPDAREIIVNSAMSVLILDAVTLETKKKISTDFGIRSVAYDKKRQRIYVAHFFSGELAAYDYVSGKKIGVIQAGPLLRCVAYSEERDRIFTGSSRALLEISPDAFEE